MNDRYLYRAKRTDNGEWVEGFYAYMKPYHYIMPKENYDSWIGIDEKTLCACTGLKDKNEKLIWENDIVTGWFDDKRITGYIMYGSNAIFFIERKGLYGIHLDNSQDWLEVIGNIFDNPELLEMGE